MVGGSVRISPYASKLVQRRNTLNMVSTIQILRGDLGTLNLSTLEVSGITNQTTIYSGKAHIHNVNGSGAPVLGEMPIDQRTVQITYPASSPMAHRDDLVKVVNDDDPDLPNRIFRVMDVGSGGMLSSWHVLTCQGWFEDRYWDGS